MLLLNAPAGLSAILSIGMFVMVLDNGAGSGVLVCESGRVISMDPWVDRVTGDWAPAVCVCSVISGRAGTTSVPGVTVCDELISLTEDCAGPRASAAFAASAALLSISSIRRCTMAGISFTYVPMSR